MNIIDIITATLIIIGSVFFLAGTVGLLRLPDVFTRLHALTKADNAGLGLIAFAAILQADDVRVVIKIILIWGLILISSATVAHLIGRVALSRGKKPWEKAS